ncbi:MFS transporter [Patulibacter sp. SYSU D01012]|uniref:MFS transporter n=1 Tax=Patulibacter sp. SYSU D01012 TaxID=2817381 RepID=UPI001B3130E0|nr:MFS transporter [Patulibacter sp. SYSU D01012]
MKTTIARRSHPNLTLAVLVLGAVSYSLLQSLVAPAMPDIARETGASASAISWVLTGYLLAASVATPILGRLGDIHGKERVLLAVLVALAAGTVVCALAPSVEVLIVGRVIQGAAGGIFPLAFAIIRDEFPREKVAGSIGLMSSLLGIGGGAGVVLAGVIVDHLSYHWLFWIPLPAILLAAVATYRYIPESPITAPGRINWAGGALLSLGLVLVLVAVSQASDWGWGSGRTLGLLLAGLVVLGGWVRSELGSSDPLVDMRMMRIRGVWTTNVAALLVGVGLYTSFILIPQFVQEPESTGYGFGASVTAAGVFLLPSTITMLAVGPAAGWIERRFGAKASLVAGCLFAAASYALLAVAHGDHWEVYLASALLGVGIGLSFAALANLIVAAVRQDQTGVATGMNTVMRTVGGAVGGQVAGTMLASGVVAATGLPKETAFTAAFAMGAAALVVGALVALLIPGRPAGGRVAEAVAPEGAAA